VRTFHFVQFDTILLDPMDEPFLEARGECEAEILQPTIGAGVFSQPGDGFPLGDFQTVDCYQIGVHVL
jgi:hypothetical protein